MKVILKLVVDSGMVFYKDTDILEIPKIGSRYRDGLFDEDFFQEILKSGNDGAEIKDIECGNPNTMQCLLFNEKLITSAKYTVDEIKKFANLHGWREEQ